MSEHRRWTEEEKARVIEMYKAGAKYKTITAETGMPQATITWVLHEERVRPRRVPRESVSVRVVMADLAETQQQLGAVISERDALIQDRNLLLEERNNLLEEVDRLRQRCAADALG